MGCGPETAKSYTAKACPHDIRGPEASSSTTTQRKKKGEKNKKRGEKRKKKKNIFKKMRFNFTKFRPKWHILKKECAANSQLFVKNCQFSKKV